MTNQNPSAEGSFSLSELMTRASSRVEDYKTLQKQGLICSSGDFFPSVHYPPITMYPPVEEEEFFAGYSLPEDGLFDVYAHIPFCRSRCLFCHYPVQLGERSPEKDRYLAALEREMDLSMDRLGIERIQARSVLVGGGTPTYLSIDQLRSFLDFFTRRVDLSACTQFNYDVDPVTLIGPEGIERLQVMRDHGVDRLTIGVQSLNPVVLRQMNRHHGVEETLGAIENCRRLGFQLNIEFIFGYPGETLENWMDVIRQAVTLDVQEIQLYRLKVEAYGDYQGPIKSIQHLHPERMPSLEETIMMKQLAIDLLNENGFHENLRRVFSRERQHFSHYADNQCCGLHDQLGFGLTAFSSLRDRFALNTQDFDAYYALIDAGRLPLNRGLLRSAEEQARWAVVLPLKNRALWRSHFEAVTGGRQLDQTFGPLLKRLESFGLVQDEGDKVVFTSLGAFVADEVVQQFHDQAYMPYPAEAYSPGPLHPYDTVRVKADPALVAV
jgi:oxygen-independent coproporphyrinogen III oxidase